ncbi:MAG TPA: MarR family transcriptional regulator [Chloroflexota bacterium]|nr:MarR family transcriptional regulator [Chloroflexota bacterium]
MGGFGASPDGGGPEGSGGAHPAPEHPVEGEAGPAAAAEREAVVTADRLHSAAIHLLRRLRRQDDASGLSAPRLSALSVIVFGGPLTLGALAAAEQVRPPTMTRLVAGLEAAGLVRRESSAADGRVVLVRATAAGEQVMAEGRRRRVGALARRLAALPADERATLFRAAEILERLTR